MSIVYAAVPFQVNVEAVPAPGLLGKYPTCTRYAWCVSLPHDKYGPVDESPAIYKTEAGAMRAGRRAAYRLAQALCEQAGKWT